jgi:hypothetical protein
MAADLLSLNDEERAVLVQSLPDLISENPRTAVAATKFKRMVVKAGSEAGDLFKKILVDVASETAKKIIWP